ncbi:MAG: hypothetical protein AAFR11_02760 [Pseudomonadota bacterium]
MSRILILAAATASLVAACASKSAPPPASPSALVARAADNDALFRYANETRSEQGCAAATPAFRVVANLGYGYEIALHQLAECLLELEGTAAERTLYREEAMSALSRAAYANVSRAQARLAQELAATPGAEKDALGWALVYADHGDRKAFGLPELSSVMLADLRVVLDDEAEAAAAEFARNFTPIRQAAFEPPSVAGARSSGGQTVRRAPPSGRRPRR